MAEDIYAEHGERKPGENEVVSEKILVTSAFVRPSETLTKIEFFGLNSNVDEGWQNIEVPIPGNYRYTIDALQIVHNVTLAAGSATLLAPNMKVMEEATRVIIDHGKAKEIYVLSLADLLTYRWEPVIDAAGAISWQKVNKQNAWYELSQKLDLGKGLDLKIRLEVPSGTNTFAVAVYSATTTPILPGSKLNADGSTPAERGHYFMLKMHAIEGAKG